MSPLDFPLAFGLDVGGTKIECVGLHGFNGKELYRQRIPTPNQSYEDLVGRIGDLIEQAEGVLGGKGTLGIGIPGAAGGRWVSVSPARPIPTAAW